MNALKKSIYGFIGMMLIMFLAGCNLPVKSPTPFIFPTVNLTQTAIFNPTVPLPVTETPSSQSTASQTLPTATNLPSVTSIPPTQILVPPTATNLPPTATHTALPPTATIPFARTSPVVSAPFLSKAPTIDGSWNDLPSSTETAANYVVYQNPAYTGTAKAGMSFRIGWDNKYLYIGLKVGDPLYHQGETGDKLYLGDSVEILMDTDVSADYFSHVLGPDDYQLGISPGYRKAGTDPEAYLWYPTGVSGDKTNVKIGVLNPSAGLYRIEIAIPWSLFGITPSVGMHLGFVLSYSDNESESLNQQSVMISNDKNRDLTDPVTWGDLTLTK
jgi:hypothetical protein